MPYQEKL
ncbi:Protein of unknown function [Lactobacillus helveticus CIRM-BIA 953]|nr:Protein of unknown function [Lactobacillus helveticus CIRM-BIA 953]